MSLLERQPVATVLTFLLIILCLGTLSGCGKKSALRPPDSSEYPRQYPRQ